MDKIAFTEAFYSIQGEGKYAGTPSVFLRTYGCNFRCKGFNMPVGSTEGMKHNPEVIPIIQNIDKYATFKDLPLVSTGCDTYASIYPEFKRFAQHQTPYELADTLAALTPPNRFGTVHLVITGGEPLLGWQKLYPQLIDKLSMDYGLTHVTFETNGTQMLTEELIGWLRMCLKETQFSVSPKLAVSGESRDKALQPEVIAQYARCVKQGWGDLYLKYVVATEADANEAMDFTEEYQDAIDEDRDTLHWPRWQPDVYLMPVGGTPEPYHYNAKDVALLAMERGFKYSPRLQVDLFKNAWGT